MTRDRPYCNSETGLPVARGRRNAVLSFFEACLSALRPLCAWQSLATSLPGREHGASNRVQTAVKRIKSPTTPRTSFAVQRLRDRK